MAEGHWVEHLFPPTFGYTTEQLLSTGGPTSSETDSSAKLGSPPPTALRRVYEKVLEDFGAEMRGRETTSTAESLEGEFTGRVSRLSWGGGPDESCIWTQQELETLREVLRAAKDQNRKLTTILDMSNKQIKTLEDKCKEQEDQLDIRYKESKEAKKEIQRLKIHSNQLNSEVTKSRSKITGLCEDIQELHVTKGNLQRQLNETTIAFEKERLLRCELEQRLQMQEQHLEDAKFKSKEAMRLRYEKEVRELQRRVLMLQEELDREQQTHGINQKALDNMRKHFASLPDTTSVEQPETEDHFMSKLSYF
ncbi:Hypp7459 [Branchiostoma lanceolatum]|uniref:Hypp7459 protein n=1 Tax=Branchiostoma lanceolatum TaxID=7740 RepID=A0A8J9Z0I2_BRALA|nr:Hypp7459 [Branchiostoma lanceolatum]